MQYYFIKTFGCQMNKNDSEILSGILEQNGYCETDNHAEADIILTNTCSVRETAERKVFGFLQILKNLKKQKPNIRIGVCGCMAEEHQDELFKYADFILGPSNLHHLAEVLAEDKPTLKTGACGLESETLERKREKSIRAWVSIMYGCNNFCSYCIVPYVRGRERSRSVENILEEIKALDKNQYKEVVLLGQNVNSYQYGLETILNKVNAAAGIERIRFMTSHPKDMRDEIINAAAALPKVCEYFHLPIQHGDNQILKSMRRGYSVEDYKRIIDKIRAKIPDAAITSDLIVGYPGESDGQFQNSLRAIEEIGFDSVNTAAFSPRKFTRAAELPDQVPQEVRSERLQELNKLVDAVALKRNQALLGTVQEILVETSSKLQVTRGKGRLPSEATSEARAKEGLTGRTRTNKIVKFKGTPDMVGELVRVKIEKAEPWILEAATVII